jgi:hypothetical protein
MVYHLFSIRTFFFAPHLPSSECKMFLLFSAPIFQENIPTRKRLAHDLFYFTSQALGEQYGPEGAKLKGLELLLTTLSKMFDSLHTAYKGWFFGFLGNHQHNLKL